MSQETIRKLAERIAERIDEELVDMCHEVTPETFRADCINTIIAELAPFGALLEAAEEVISIEMCLKFEGRDQLPYIHGLDTLIRAKAALRAALSDIQKG